MTQYFIAIMFTPYLVLYNLISIYCLPRMAKWQPNLIKSAFQMVDKAYLLNIQSILYDIYSILYERNSIIKTP